MVTFTVCSSEHANKEHAEDRVKMTGILFDDSQCSRTPSMYLEGPGNQLDRLRLITLPY